MINIHPIVVHFPIVLVILAMFFQILEVIKKLPKGMANAPIWIMYLATIASIAGAASGYWASEIIGHDHPRHELVHEHRNLMLWFTGIITSGSAIHLFVKKIQTPIFRLILLVSSALIMIIGAEKGGNLVYEHGIGVKILQQGFKTNEEIEKIHTHSDGSKHTH